jgi:hypothetical protein
MRFTWHAVWAPLFDGQLDIIRHDIRRAKCEGNLVAYLCCPISSLGGSIMETNIEISKHTARRIVNQWGHKLWVLNPTQYQLESKVGRNLIEDHARQLGIDTEALPKPSGGDYMRMWSKLLIEDERDNLGGVFDMYYFLGPSDIHSFFSAGGSITVTAAVEEFFARKVAMDPEFRRHFFPPFYDRNGQPMPSYEEGREWEARRREFFRFYTVRASSVYSKGCHDIWNIWRMINQRRAEKFGIEALIPGYYEGNQLDPSAHSATASKGHEV